MPVLRILSANVWQVHKYTFCHTTTRGITPTSRQTQRVFSVTQINEAGKKTAVTGSIIQYVTSVAVEAFLFGCDFNYLQIQGLSSFVLL